MKVQGYWGLCVCILACFELTVITVESTELRVGKAHPAQHFDAAQ
jgi:hypothetical protein